MITVTFPEFFNWLLTLMMILFLVFEAAKIYLFFLHRKLDKLNEFTVTQPDGTQRKARWIEPYKAAK